MLAIIITVTATACSEVLPTGVVLDLNTLTLDVNKTGQLNAAITSVSDEFASVDLLEWSSSNVSVATIDANGLVTAIKKGESTITVSLKGYDISDTCVVTVTDLAGLKAIKIKEISTLKATYKEADYTAENWATITELVNADIAKVNALTTIEEVTAYTTSELKASADKIDTVAMSIAEAKASKIKEISTLKATYKEADYTAKNWATITELVNADTDKVNALTTIEEVTAYTTTELKASVDEILTIAEQLVIAKDSKIDELDTIKKNYTESNYNTVHWASIVKIFDESSAYVKGCVSVEEVHACVIADIENALNAVSYDVTIEIAPTKQIFTDNYFNKPRVDGQWITLTDNKHFYVVVDQSPILLDKNTFTIDGATYNGEYYAGLSVGNSNFVADNKFMVIDGELCLSLTTLAIDAVSGVLDCDFNGRNYLITVASQLTSAATVSKVSAGNIQHAPTAKAYSSMSGNEESGYLINHYKTNNNATVDIEINTGDNAVVGTVFTKKVKAGVVSYGLTDFAPKVTLYTTGWDPVNSAYTGHDVLDYTIFIDGFSPLVMTINSNPYSDILDPAKTEKLASISTLKATYKEADYAAENWATITELVNAATAKVNALTTIEEVTAYTTTELKASVDEILTIVDQETVSTVEEFNAAIAAGQKVIRMAEGTYDITSNIVVGHDVEIIGTNAVINYNSTAGNCSVFEIKSPNFKISGVDINVLSTTGKCYVFNMTVIDSNIFINNVHVLIVANDKDHRGVAYGESSANSTLTLVNSKIILGTSDFVDGHKYGGDSRGVSFWRSSKTICNITDSEISGFKYVLNIGDDDATESTTENITVCTNNSAFKGWAAINAFTSSGKYVFNHSHFEGINIHGAGDNSYSTINFNAGSTENDITFTGGTVTNKLTENSIEYKHSQNLFNFRNANSISSLVLDGVRLVDTTGKIQSAIYSSGRDEKETFKLFNDKITVSGATTFETIEGNTFKLFNTVVTADRFTPPTKLTYKLNEELVLDGAKIIATIDGVENEYLITKTDLSGYDKTKLGEQTLTVNKFGYTYTFVVTVVE